MFKWTRNAVCAPSVSSFSSRHWGNFIRMGGEKGIGTEFLASKGGHGQRGWNCCLPALQEHQPGQISASAI